MLNSFKAPQGEGWVYEREKEGIKVFTKKSAWGKLRDSRAEMKVASTPEQMLAILTDFNNYQTWMPRCKKSRLLARPSENEYIVYTYLSVPWPLKDRDCVMRMRIDKDAKSGVITITQTSEPKYIKEENNVVRIQQMISTWKLIPSSQGTLVINEYGSNPGGDLPDWIVNSQSVENPLSTFENLQQKVVSKK